MNPTRKAPPGCLWLADAADYLGIPITTFRKWRLKNYGPGGFPVGRRVAYRIEVLDAWLAEQEAADPHSNPELRESEAQVEARLIRSR
jgi:hypothetical protein